MLADVQSKVTNEGTTQATELLLSQINENKDNGLIDIDIESKLKIDKLFSSKLDIDLDLLGKKILDLDIDAKVKSDLLKIKEELKIDIEIGGDKKCKKEKHEKECKEKRHEKKCEKEHEKKCEKEHEKKYWTAS